MSPGWLLSLLIAAAPASAEPVEITLTAERVLHDGQTKRTIAEGKAHLETAGAAIDAERIFYDQPRETVLAVGSVIARLVQGTAPTVMIGDVVELRLEGEQVVEAHVLDGRAFAKAGADPGRLLAATTLAEADRAGRSTMVMSGNHFVREDDGWRMEDLELTPCDCDLNSPSWSIRTPEATLNKDADRVAVKWPVTWVKKLPLVKELPVFGLPWLSLPLTDRATGLLFPKPGSTVLNGFSFEQPVFVTLGRSADLTLTPGYFFGGPQRTLEEPGRVGLFRSDLGRSFQSTWRNGVNDPSPSNFLQPFGIMGPRLLTEFRYVLSERAYGRATLGLLYDLREQRDPGNPALSIDRPRGLRGEASVFHLQDLGRGFGARMELAAYSDGNYQRDITPDVIVREAGYLRSTAALFHRGVDHLLTLDAVLRQDLTSGYDLFGRDVFLRGSVAPKHGPNPIQRLPALTFALPLKPLVGPLAFDASADVVQQMPLRFGTGDEGALANEGRFFDPYTGLELPAECVVERLYLARGASQLAQCPTTVLPNNPANALKAGLGDGRWQPGEREARLRLNAMPRLWAGGALGGLFPVSAMAAWRQGVWLGESSGRTMSRGYPLLAAKTELELARVYDGAVRHSVTPVLEARAVPFVAATSSRPLDPSLLGGPAAYDEIDRSISDNRPRVQAVAELRNRLVQRGGRELLRLDLGQGFDLLSPVTPGPGGVLAPESAQTFHRPRLAEAYARLAASIGWVTLGAQARVEPLWRKSADVAPSPRLTRAQGSFSFDLPQGHGLNATYENVLDDGTNRARAPIDLLFGDPVPAAAESRAQLFTAGARVRFGSFGLRYDLVLLNRQWPRLDALGQPVKDERGVAQQDTLLSLGQHSVSATWTPACECFRLDLSVVQRLTATGTLGPPEFASFNFSVLRFGSIGASR
ncbi:MAG: LPS-assembly protein LptD [Myxococcaceae bacterium]|nr:LPS-assembly protein LptD [Myxococcaceae bacterium]